LLAIKDVLDKPKDENAKTKALGENDKLLRNLEELKTALKGGDPRTLGEDVEGPMNVDQLMKSVKDLEEYIIFSFFFYSESQIYFLQSLCTVFTLYLSSKFSRYLFNLNSQLKELNNLNQKAKSGDQNALKQMAPLANRIDNSVVYSYSASLFSLFVLFCFVLFGFVWFGLVWFGCVCSHF
jgi:hypothetical protein